MGLHDFKSALLSIRKEPQAFLKTEIPLLDFQQQQQQKNRMDGIVKAREQKALF